MSFELSAEHEQFRRTVRDFAEKEIAPHAAQWDRDHHFPVDVVQQDGRPRAVRPDRARGVRRRRRREDGGFTSLCVAIEELGRVDQSMGITLEAGGRARASTRSSPTAPTSRRSTWLPDLVAGRTLAGFGLTEAGAGLRRRGHQDQGRCSTTASGSSTAPSSSSPTPARRSPRWSPSPPAPASVDGKPEISAIIVPAGTPGFIAEKAYDKLGWHASDTHPLTFEDARVPEANLLGERGRGYAQFLATLDDGRVAIAAARRRLHPGLPRHGRRVRRRAHHLRRADRSQAGRGLPDRRPRR